jgi:N-acetylmuramoyl-L-alanine amidase
VHARHGRSGSPPATEPLRDAVHGAVPSAPCQRLTDREVITNLSPAQVVALTAYGEARSEPPRGRVGVVNTIANRLAAQRDAYGLDLKAVCLKRWQYSCWMPEGGRANYESLLITARHLLKAERSIGPILQHCLDLGAQLVAGTLEDVVKGATHYVNPDAMKPRGRLPAWAIGLTPTVIIGSHWFYKP